MTFEEWVEKYKPIKNWLRKDEDADTFETFGVEVGIVLGVNRFNEKQVWTLVDGDEGMWVTNGYHFVNRVSYFITEIPYEGEDFLDVLYMEYGDDDLDDDDEELAWVEKTSRLASAKTEEEVEAIIAK